MGDSQGKQRIGYNTWSVEESSILLELMVDATNRGWRSTNGSHPKQRHLRIDTIADYEDLHVAVGNATATGRNSIGLGDESDARIYGVEENRHVTIDDYVFDESQEAYIQSQHDQSNYVPSYENYNFCPATMETNKEIPTQNKGPKKRTRVEYEDNSSSFETMTRADVQAKISLPMDSITEIVADIRGMLKLIEKRERDRENKEIENKEVENKNNIWNAIKEIPNLDNHTRYKVPSFIHKFGMKDAFLKMSHEERWEWIKYNVE
ncbi:hypothetical protein Adt_10134 [Abeliophyllum distichum]|uniref:At2g29880-like C-terminal domain-containing protein n=1 Tax=Abeliophyllum distichum TaxID=126358 RepID=A0ABD1UKI5_9LAMI